MVREELAQYRGGNALLFRATEPEVLLSGPSRTGKSQAACEHLNRLCLEHPGAELLMVRKTRESLTQSGLITMRRRIMPGSAHWFGSSEWRYANGSRIVATGMNEPTRIMSSEWDAVYVQEATELTEGDWEYLTTRLSGQTLPFRFIVGDCNPAGERHWLKLRGETDKLRMIETRHEDNPVLFEEDGTITPFGREYIAKLDALTGVRYKRLRLGIWCSAEGMIYDEFDYSVHVRDRSEVFPEGYVCPPLHWRRVWTVDFGFTNPFVWQAWAQSPETGSMYRYAELYHTKMLVEDAADRVLYWKDEHREPWPEAIVCDHDAEGRETLKRRWKIGTVAAKKDVKEGIQAVQQRVRNQTLGAQGVVFLRDSSITRRPDQRLVDEKKPTSTEEEVDSYVWKDTVKDSEPVKVDDHGLDAARYMVMYVDGAQREWSVDEILAYGRNEVVPVPGGDQPPAEVATPLSDEDEREEYLRKVAAQQADQLRRLTGRGT